jgi:hypothetical protein
MRGIVAYHIEPEGTGAQVTIRNVGAAPDRLRSDTYCGTVARWMSNCDVAPHTAARMMPVSVFWKVFPENQPLALRNARFKHRAAAVLASTSRIAWRPAQKLQERGSRRCDFLII